jgi:hypothetical protein
MGEELGRGHLKRGGERLSERNLTTVAERRKLPDKAEVVQAEQEHSAREGGDVDSAMPAVRLTLVGERTGG